MAKQSAEAATLQAAFAVSSATGTHVNGWNGASEQNAVSVKAKPKARFGVNLGFSSASPRPREPYEKGGPDGSFQMSYYQQGILEVFLKQTL